MKKYLIRTLNEPISEWDIDADFYHVSEGLAMFFVSEEDKTTRMIATVPVHMVFICEYDQPKI